MSRSGSLELGTPAISVCPGPDLSFFLCVEAGVFNYASGGTATTDTSRYSPSFHPLLTVLLILLDKLYDREVD